MTGIFIIMHKNKVLGELYFTSLEKARNYIKFLFRYKTFNEPEENKFVCRQYGTTFKIIELLNF